MQITDMREMEAGRELRCQVCLVGSGPAGTTIAKELSAAGFHVMIVESGSRDREDPFALSLNEIESVGAPRVLESSKVRNRILGGSSHTWSGRCTTLDPMDYEARPWVPFSGWPFGPAEMQPYFTRAAKVLGLKQSSYDNALFQELHLPRRFDGSDGDDVRSVFWQLSRRSPRDSDHVRFGAGYEHAQATRMEILTNATLTEIVTDESRARVEALHLRTEGGAQHRVTAQAFVLCAGGIENARLLLLSQRKGRGVGNALVGRFLMDHPRTTLGTFAPGAASAIEREFFLLRPGEGVRVQRGLSLAFAVQRREQLLNCAAWVLQDLAEDDAWVALRGLLREKGRRRLRHGRVVARNAGQLAHGVWRKLVQRRSLPRRFKALDLAVLVEQTPNPESRILLSDRCDSLGMPRVRVDWKIGEMERRTVVRLGQAIHRALGAAALPQPELVDWVRDDRPQDAAFFDPAHPLGATRMADSPERGVVDPQCKVFGVENLWIGGSSVFPTSGHANPTMMLVALALRLADELKRALTR